jgi:NADH-quinone oxidoreductase subunit L
MISFLVHVFSTSYMHGDQRFTHFFAALSLFTTGMYVLVTASGTLQALFGWEMMGLCSFMLIGHWWEEQKNSDAALKAFFTTRTGDIGFLVGISILFFAAGQTFDIATINATALDGTMGDTAVLLGGIALMSAIIGKSAQFPLHTWLPDAMAGPTPVSALIHAATMVTAGVYLVVRTHALFEASPLALGVVAIVGLVTAVYAGLSALGQDDLKRVLAYSTISQLGYMFLAAGLSAYSVAIFHLVTHAFFKALLFLSAGSVMHATDGEINLLRLGGLRRSMPWTAAFFGVGALALAGIPLFAGFFSKDQILSAAYTGGRTELWIVGLVAAFLTGLYVTRAFALTFTGEPRLGRHPQESPLLMTVPMGVLAALSVAGGLLGLSVSNGRIQSFLAPVVGAAEPPAVSGGLSEAALSIIASAVAVGGIALGWFVYGSGRIDWAALRARYAGARRALARGFFVDDLYGALIVLPGKAASAFLAYVVDRRVIDGAVNGLGELFRGLAGAGRRVQSGLVRTYALAYLLGAVAVLVVVVLVRA